VFDMSVLAVDTAALARLTDRIRRAAAEARAAGSRPGPLHHTAGALNSSVLAGAVADLTVRWGWVLRELTDEADRLADAVDLVGRSYEDAERLAHSLARPSSVVPAAGLLPFGRASEGGLPLGRASEGGLPLGRASGGGLPSGRASGGGLPLGRASGGAG
jgi:hypothetical protein